MVALICILLAIFAVLWLVGEFFPQAALLARICRILWVVLATILLCGVRLHVE